MKVRFIILLSATYTFTAMANQCWDNQYHAGANVSGSKTGAFIREIGAAGNNTIQSCVTIPSDIIRFASQDFSSNEGLMFNPHLYLGFNLPAGQNVEVGLEYHRGSTALSPSMNPYIAVSANWANKYGCTTSKGDGRNRVHFGKDYGFLPGDKVCFKGVYSEKGRLSLEILPTSARQGGKTVPLAKGWIDCGVNVPLAQIKPRRTTSIATAARKTFADNDINFTSSNDLGDLFFGAKWEATQIGVNGNAAADFKRVLEDNASCSNSVNFPADGTSVSSNGASNYALIKGPQVHSDLLKDITARLDSVVPALTERHWYYVDNNLSFMLPEPIEINWSKINIDHSLVKNTEKNIAVNNRPASTLNPKKQVEAVDLASIGSIFPKIPNDKNETSLPHSDKKLSNPYILNEAIEIVDIKTDKKLKLRKGDIVDYIKGVSGIPAWTYGIKVIKSSRISNSDQLFYTSKYYFILAAKKIENDLNDLNDKKREDQVIAELPIKEEIVSDKIGSCFTKKVVPWTGTYYRKVESSSRTDYRGIEIEARLPQVEMDANRNYINPAVKNRPSAIDHWQTGSMDRPAMYLGGALGGHELDVGITWRKMCDTEGRPVYTDLNSGTDGRDADHRFVEDYNENGVPTIINGHGEVQVTGRAEVDRMKMSLVANYAFRPFIRSPSFGRGWYPWEKPESGESNCTSEVNKVVTYYYPGDRFSMVLKMNGENKMILKTDLIEGVGRDAEDVGATSFEQSFAHNGANSWSNKSFKRVHTIDQYREDGKGNRVNNAKPDWVVRTNTKLRAGKWESVRLLTTRSNQGEAMTCGGGSTEVWGTDINQLNNRRTIFEIKNQDSRGGEEFSIIPYDY